MDHADNDLIRRLREEANEVKRCVTTYSFAALTFSSAVFAAIAATIEKIEWVAFAGLPVVALLMVVCRISIYKYSTANRNYGYELHLARLESFKTACKPDIYKSLKELEWEATPGLCLFVLHLTKLQTTRVTMLEPIYRTW